MLVIHVKNDLKPTTRSPGVSFSASTSPITGKKYVWNIKTLSGLILIQHFLRKDQPQIIYYKNTKLVKTKLMNSVLNIC